MVASLAKAVPEPRPAQQVFDFAPSAATLPGPKSQAETRVPPSPGPEMSSMTQIVQPSDEAAITDAVLAAIADKTPITIEGSGTKAAVGRPAQSAVTLSTARLSGITLYEPAELVISARAGTPLSAIEAALAEKGQMLPFEPMDYRPLLGSSGEPTVGGMVAANLSGPRRIMAGACRDSLIGVRMVNGRGEAIKSGGRVMKNVTGLDLARLMAGSWGTLGILSEVTLKVSPRPETSATLAFHGLDDVRAVAALSDALGSPFEVSGAAHLPIGIDRVSTTLMRIEGFKPSVSYRLGALKALLKSYGPADVIEGEAATRLWQSVKTASFLSEPRERAIWRLSVAPSKAAAIVGQIKDARAIQHLLDWGGGLVWIATGAEGEAGARVIRTALEGSQGHATLVRAPIEVRAAVPVFEPLPAAMMTLTGGLKASFDPHRLFNSGRMYAGV
jgi:glycolate oxidase FAD binding subunit